MENGVAAQLQLSLVGEGSAADIRLADMRRAAHPHLRLLLALFVLELRQLAVKALQLACAGNTTAGEAGNWTYPHNS